MAKRAPTEELDEMARAPSGKSNAGSNLLSQLEFGNVKRNANVNIADPLLRARQKFQEGVDEQIKYATADIKGEDYSPTRIRYIDQPDGSRAREQVKKRKMLWWWQLGDVYWTEVRYGSSSVNFGDKGSAIKAGKSLDDVIKILEIVAKAAQNGEMDAELLRLAAQRGRGRRNRPQR